MEELKKELLRSLIPTVGVAIEIGYLNALTDYGIWSDGVQTIGCLKRNILECFEEYKSSGRADLEATALVNLIIDGLTKKESP